MIVVINADHRGRNLAKKLVKRMRNSGNKVIDLMSKEADPGDDYPLLADELCERVLAIEGAKGILICGSGMGMAMAANKHKGIRAANCVNAKQARGVREHQDSNVLCLGADDMDEEFAMGIIVVWLSVKFLSQEKQIRRIRQIDGERG